MSQGRKALYASMLAGSAISAVVLLLAGNGIAAMWAIAATAWCASSASWESHALRLADAELADFIAAIDRTRGTK